MKNKLLLATIVALFHLTISVRAQQVLTMDVFVVNGSSTFSYPSLTSCQMGMTVLSGPSGPGTTALASAPVVITKPHDKISYILHKAMMDGEVFGNIMFTWSDPNAKQGESTTHIMKLNDVRVIEMQRSSAPGACQGPCPPFAESFKLSFNSVLIAYYELQGDGGYKLLETLNFSGTPSNPGGEPIPTNPQ